MQPWPKQHRNLLAIVLLVGTACTLAWLLAIRPLLTEVKALRASADGKRAELSKTGWRLDVPYLQSILRDRTRQANAIDSRAAKVLAHANQMFAARVKQLYGSPEAFRLEVSRLDFQEEYNQAERKLMARGIALSESVTNLGENTASPFTYQLLWHLWTLTEALEVAWEMGLRPELDPETVVVTEDGRSLPAAEARVLPIRAYTLNKTESEPYVIEFPIRLTLHGDLGSLMRFLQALNSGSRFLPVTSIEVKKQPPTIRNPDLQRLSVQIQCSSFFLLRNDLPRQRQTETRVIPRGA